MAFTDTPDPADPDQLPLTAHLSWDRAGHCVGQVSLTGRGSAELLVSGGTTWLKPDARFARAEFGAAGAAMLAGKYLKGPTTDRHFADVSMTTDEYQKNLCQAGVVTLSIPDEDDQLSTKVGPATVGGVPTVDILPDGKGTTDTFIAAEGTPYVIQSGKQGGIAFTDYGKPVAFQLPPEPDRGREQAPPGLSRPGLAAGTNAGRRSSGARADACPRRPPGHPGRILRAFIRTTEQGPSVRFPGLTRISTALCLGALALALAPAPSALAAGSPTASAPASAPADPGSDPGSGSGSGSGNDANWTSADAEAFWTPALMASAVPETTATGPAPSTTPSTAPSASASPAGPGVHAAASGPRPAAAAVPTGTHFAGVPSIGTLYYLGKDQTAHNCTASVVKSPGKDLILTAGHCAPGPGGHTAFVPEYNQGKEPFGIWAVTSGYTLPGHSTSGTASNLDFAFGVVADLNGRKLEDVTGGNTLTRTPGYNNPAVTVIGYPGKSKDGHDQPIKCTVPTVRLPGAGLTQIQIACDDFWDGVSGGPWLINFNGTTGDIIGNVGGLNGGGLPNPNEKYYDRYSYSPVYGDQIFSLYQQATAGAVAPPPAAYSMGTRSLWKDARHVVAGNFTGKPRAEDMITVWVDGEVTLYHGDGNSHFTGETQLVPPNSVWKDAVSVTAGTFTPESDQSGLVVRWIDGELDLYPDVSAAGIGPEVRLENTNATWTKATVVAGQFGGNGKVPTGLVVAWSDGHVSEFPNITSHSMTGEVQMIAANKTWTWMRGVAAATWPATTGPTWWSAGPTAP
ncbi:hypothetical protein GXW82_33710 [Streptacidiphilus sp. 4-A2]|nr:hypothetical protein [Streptacidiphilus sp. 4-A2]